jgi:8-oxo-dGTP pyrophosphatase MutT (NUDIX family)
MPKPSNAKLNIVRSAGGVVLRQGTSGLEALLIATHNRHRWGLPKGRIEPGEDARAAALREVAEETGITASILGPLERVEYWIRVTAGQRRQKQVDYFLMKYQSGQAVPQLSEVDDARWWPIEEAITRVAYHNSRRLLELAREQWGERAS